MKKYLVLALLACVLAHDLCVVAISNGEERAKWLAAASLDRFLVAIGRQQRFGTQFSSKRSFHAPKLSPVDPNVPDQLRRALNVPSLDEAKARLQLSAAQRPHSLPRFCRTSRGFSA